MKHLFLMFLDHTQRRTTVGGTPLDEWSARRRDLYLRTHDTHNRQISMPPVGFEPTISAGERPHFAIRCVLYWCPKTSEPWFYINTFDNVDFLHCKPNMFNDNRLLLFICGNAISGASSINGTSQFPKPPIMICITMKKIMTKAWAVIMTL